MDSPFRRLYTETELQDWLRYQPEPDARVVAVCALDDYCVNTPSLRCPCCEQMVCDDHAAASLLCLACEDWCERQGEMA